MADGGIIEIGLWQLSAAYAFVVLLLVLVRWRGIRREREIIVSSVRMTLQLVLVGYVLGFVFESRHPAFSIGFLVAMLVFAVYNTYKRVKHPLSPRLRRVIALSMTAGTTVSLGFFILVVLMLDPWYSPRYFIPIAGMIVGNSMTGISLGVNALIQGIHRQRQQIEGSLMLGARPQEAVKEIANEAFDSAILPTINSMVGMGIVFLPGMMTGQILAGLSPITAIEYQIAIMLGILGSVSLTVILFVYYGCRTFFNERAQLLDSDRTS